MRVSQQIVVVIAVCLLGALLVFGSVAERYKEVERLQSELQSTKLAEKDIDYIKIMFLQWLVTIDLFFGEEESYLAIGIQKQARQIVEALGNIERRDGSTTTIESISKQVQKVSNYVKVASESSGQSDSGWNDTIEHVDNLTISLIDDIEATAGATTDAVATLERQLSGAQRSFTLFCSVVLALYLGVVGYAWRWSTLRIVVPLERISTAAEAASTNHDGFSVEDGNAPKEVKRLARKLGEYSLSLEEAIDEAQRATKRTQRIIHSAPDGILTVSSKGVVADANQVAQAYFSLDERFNAKLSLVALIPDFPAEYLATVPPANEMPLEFYGCRTDASRFPLEASFSKVGIDDEAVLTVIVHDISQRKEQENALAEANARLIDASRLAGIGEIASSLLHNIGNVLNSLQTSNSLVREKLTSSRIQGLGKASGLLKKLAEEDAGVVDLAKLRKLADYVEQLDVELNKEKEDALSEFDRSVENVVHIAQIVKSQQKHAGVNGIEEDVDIAKLLDDALQMNRTSLDNYEIETSKNYDALPAVWADKHKLMQVVVNLVRNAKDAIVEQNPERPCIEISAAATADGYLEIGVGDNGIGMSEDVQSKLFQHGFTTKKAGHGFGLHSCGIVAQNMGGTITASSEGVGLGSRFVFLIPMEIQEAANG